MIKMSSVSCLQMCAVSGRRSGAEDCLSLGVDSSFITRKDFCSVVLVSKPTYMCDSEEHMSAVPSK